MEADDAAKILKAFAEKNCRDQSPLYEHLCLGVIDFADFGFGHFLYDMGITLFGLWGLDDDLRQRKAFLTGYREVRPFSLDHENLLDLFVAARAVVQARFVMSSEHSADQRIATRYVQKVVKGLRLWLSTSSPMK